LTPYNSAEHIELAPENPERPRPWSPEECLRFLHHIGEDRLAALYELMLVTGLRRGEAIGLRWEDVDLEGEALLIVQQLTDVRGRSIVGTPKTKRGRRIVPIDPGTAATLKRHRASQETECWAAGPAWTESGLVFTRPDGRPLRPEYATRHFQKLAAQAGLPVIRLHDLRHTNASLALSAGVPLKVVSERLGHSQTAITADLYTHVNAGVGRSAAAQIAAPLRSAATQAEAIPSDSLASGPVGAGSDRHDDAWQSTTNEAPNRVSAGQGPAP
jgi:integrase